MPRVEVCKEEERMQDGSMQGTKAAEEVGMGGGGRGRGKYAGRISTDELACV